MTNKQRQKAKNRRDSSHDIKSDFPSMPPKNPLDFERDWRRHCSTHEAKLRYLLLCGPLGLRQIFKTEIDVVLLGHLLAALAETVRLHRLHQTTVNSDEDEVSGTDPQGSSTENDCGASPAEIFAIMATLPNTGRFKLNLKFLGQSDKNCVENILTWLAEVAPSETCPPSEGEELASAEYPFSADSIERLRAKFK